MNIKWPSPSKVVGHLFTIACVIVFLRFGWLVVDGEHPRPVLFLMVYCAVCYALISLAMYAAEKSVAKQKQERRR